MKFKARWLETSTQSIIEQAVDAESEADLRLRLEAQGYVVFELRAQRLATEAEPGGRFDVSWWCRELRTLIGAGMTVVEAIEAMAADTSDSARHRVHRALLKALREGQSLSKAMRGAQAFPEVLIASVTASERTSNLSETLHDYLRYSEVLERLRRQAVSAAIYPGVVIALGTLISLFLLVVVIPRFSRMYVDGQASFSVPTQGILWLSQLLKAQWPWLLCGAVALGIGSVWAGRRGLAQPMLAELIERCGPLRRNWDQFRLAKFYQSLAMMFKGGYTLGEGLLVCQGLQLGPRMLQRLLQAQGAIGEGRAASHAFEQAGLTEPVTYRLLAVGERSGEFDAVLRTIAERHAQHFETFVERATRIIEPLLLLLVALVVGGIVVMMYMPIFDMAGNLRGGR